MIKIVTLYIIVGRDNIHLYEMIHIVTIVSVVTY